MYTNYIHAVLLLVCTKIDCYIIVFLHAGNAMLLSYDETWRNLLIHYDDTWDDEKKTYQGKGCIVRGDKFPVT